MPVRSTTYHSKLLLWLCRISTIFHLYVLIDLGSSVMLSTGLTMSEIWPRLPRASADWGRRLGMPRGSDMASNWRPLTAIRPLITSIQSEPDICSLSGDMRRPRGNGGSWTLMDTISLERYFAARVQPKARQHCTSSSAGSAGSATKRGGGLLATGVGDVNIFNIRHAPRSGRNVKGPSSRR